MSRCTEMTLDELLADPVIRLLMASDRVDIPALRQTAREVRMRMTTQGLESRDPERQPHRTGEVPQRNRGDRRASSFEVMQLAS